jgi:hypothetical protein
MGQAGFRLFVCPFICVERLLKAFLDGRPKNTPKPQLENSAA